MNEENQYGPAPAGSYEEPPPPQPNQYGPVDAPPVPMPNGYDNSGPSYDNSNNIPSNNYNSNGPAPTNGRPADYYDEPQPNDIYSSSASSTHSKTSEKLTKEKKK